MLYNQNILLVHKPANIMYTIIVVVKNQKVKYGSTFYVSVSAVIYLHAKLYCRKQRSIMKRVFYVGTIQKIRINKVVVVMAISQSAKGKPKYNF